MRVEIAFLASIDVFSGTKAFYQNLQVENQEKLPKIYLVGPISCISSKRGQQTLNRQTDRHTDTQSKYRNPPAHAPRVNQGAKPSA